ncbi:hypothetical protein QCA50_011807 [Cerrena zonata]|uniref:Protein kinase domain-containing protein n=1 Tax=Cerrena zonata TaxID=2478898 RepID=A0AAW0G5N4_9APHY
MSEGDLTRRLGLGDTPSLLPFDIVVQIGRALQFQMSDNLIRYLDRQVDIHALLSTQHTLSTWCLVCRMWYDALSPVLLRNVVLYQHKQASRLSRILRQKGQYTDTIVLDCAQSANLWTHIGTMTNLRSLTTLVITYLDPSSVHPNFSKVLSVLRRMSSYCKIYILEVNYRSLLQVSKILNVLPPFGNTVPGRPSFPITIRPLHKPVDGVVGYTGHLLFHALQKDAYADWKRMDLDFRGFMRTDHHDDEDQQVAMLVNNSLKILEQRLGFVKLIRFDSIYFPNARKNLDTLLSILLPLLQGKAFVSGTAHQHEVISEAIFRLLWNYHPCLSPTGASTTPPNIDGVLARSLINCLQSFVDIFEHSLYHNVRRAFVLYLAELCWITGTIPQSMDLDVEYTSSDPFAIGHSSDIFKATWQGQIVAVKSIRGSPDRESASNDLFCHEVVTWRQLRHENILTLIGTCSPRSAGLLPCLVYPMYSTGNINIRQALDLWSVEVKQLEDWLYQIARGVEYLHSENVVHDAIRGNNIIITDNHCVKIDNFGFSKLFRTPGFPSIPTYGGSVRWMPPELLNEYANAVPNTTSDVYSFACTSVELYTRDRPFPEVPTETEVITQIVNGARPSRPSALSWKTMSKQLWQLLERCWDRDDDKRPTMKEVVFELSKPDWRQ